MKSGYAREDITPDRPLRLAGIGEDRFGKTVLDPLSVRALALRDRGGRRALLLVFDLLYVGTALAERVYASVGKSLGIPRDAVLTVATHTHSAPKTAEDFQDGTDIDVRYHDAVADAALRAAERAVSALQPASLAIGRWVGAPALNRRVAVPVWARALPSMRRAKVLNRPNFAANPDTRVTAARITFEDGRFVWIVNAALHAAIHRGEAYSADFPGYLPARIQERETSDTCLDVMFLQGWTGDQSAGLTRRLAPSLHPGRMIDYLVHASVFERDAGEAGLVAIADKLCASLDGSDFSAQQEDGDLVCRKQTLRVPLENGGSRDIQLKLVMLNGLRVLAVNGEPFASYGLALKHAAGPVMTVGYLDGPFGYLPDSRGLREGGYEPDRSISLFGQPSRFAPAAVDDFMDATQRLVSGRDAVE